MNKLFKKQVYINYQKTEHNSIEEAFLFPNKRAIYNFLIFEFLIFCFSKLAKSAFFDPK